MLIVIGLGIQITALTQSNRELRTENEELRSRLGIDKDITLEEERMKSIRDTFSGDDSKSVGASNAGKKSSLI